MLFIPKVETQETLLRRNSLSTSTAPYRWRDYYYYSRFEEQSQYPVYYRKKVVVGSKEEVLLDANKLAEGHPYLALAPFQISSDQHILAFSVDTVGNRLYSVHLKQVSTGKSFPDVIPDATHNLA